MTKEVMKHALNVLLLVEAEMNCEYGVTESLRQAIAEAENQEQDEPVAYINVEKRMNEVLISGFGVSYKGVGLSVNTTHDGSTITFTSGDIIKDILTDPRTTDNGKSVGERNIDWLHEKLDEWIKKQLEQT